jgi:SAM-dependent methyltransferase
LQKCDHRGVTQQRDQWAEWLAVRRFGGNGEVRRRYLGRLMRRRDEVLDRAGVAEGDVVLDVGCGEGLIGFGALARGAAVVFSDISEALLKFCEEGASELGVLDRCRFVRASADDLGALADAEVDVVTTRSVLIYVADKPAAFGEFFRVLRPDGRISLFEPINRFAGQSFLGYDLRPLGDLAERIDAVYGDKDAADDDPMLDFDERDLVRFAEEAGFFPIRLSLELELRPTDAEPLDAFLDRAPNPLVPTLREAMAEALNRQEQEHVVSYLQPLVENGRGVWRMASAYLAGTRRTG